MKNQFSQVGALGWGKEDLDGEICTGAPAALVGCVLNRKVSTEMMIVFLPLTAQVKYFGANVHAPHGIFMHLEPSFRVFG